MRIGISVAMVVAAVVLVGLLATDSVGDQPARKQAQGAGFPGLVEGLKETPGCLGVEVAKLESGKNVVFAWFENRKSLSKWYYSETHQKFMAKGFPDQEFDKPLKEVPEDSGPILAIASVTFADKPHFKETPLPISQIAIELYQPLKGGVFLGGRFAPAGVKVPGMKDYTAKGK
jgi:hypothetical protein